MKLAPISAKALGITLRYVCALGGQPLMHMPKRTRRNVRRNWRRFERMRFTFVCAPPDDAINCRCI